VGIKKLPGPSTFPDYSTVNAESAGTYNSRVKRTGIRLPLCCASPLLNQKSYCRKLKNVQLEMVTEMVFSRRWVVVLPITVVIRRNLHLFRILARCRFVRFWRLEILRVILVGIMVMPLPIFYGTAIPSPSVLLLLGRDLCVRKSDI
jgi:hypothetical protein